MDRIDRFWNRVTEGMRVDQLWKQFQTDARSSYRLYSKEVDSERVAGVSKGKHFFRVAGQFFWAVLEKLSPARRVLLLIALVLMFVPDGEAHVASSAGDEVAFALRYPLLGRAADVRSCWFSRWATAW